MSTELRVHVVESAEIACTAAAAEIARLLNTTLRAHDRATVALSRSDPEFVEALVGAAVDWHRVDGFQVDERIAPAGSHERNTTALAPLTDLLGGWFPMPVEAKEPLDAARRYETALHQIAGGVLDVVHLGLGADGHTASLLAGDAALASADRLVAATAMSDGFRRITLTVDALNAARHLVWLATGETKAVAVRGLVAADPTIPAGRILQDRAVVFTDEPAASIILSG